MSTLYANQMDDTKPDFSRRLLCIEYPGRVENINNMLDTLGGIKGISMAYAVKNRRVELRFRPDDVFCKPACGNRYSTVGLLVKVKVKKKLRDPNLPCSSKDSDKLHSMTFTTSLVGIVDTIYKFENICEFQYLPMDRLSSQHPDDTNLQDISDKLFPNEMPTMDWFYRDDIPCYFVPAVFSRFDTVHFYTSKDNSIVGIKGSRQSGKRKEVPSTHTIGRTRKRRQNYGVFVRFADNPIPEAANPEAIRLLTVKFVTEEQKHIVEQLFEERPIWSKNGLIYRTNFNKDQLKYILPTVAFYFTTGPWRVMWCKYGYDPRKNPKNVMYQTFDFRIKQQGFKVKPKRSYANVLLPYKSTPASRPKVVIMNRHSINRAVTEAKTNDVQKKKLSEKTYIFRPGYVPLSRQIFYQYCDVLVPEIQKMLEDLLPTLLPNSPCDNMTGFLPAGFDNKCREIVHALVQDELSKVKDKPCTSTSWANEEEILNEEIQDDSVDEDDDIANDDNYDDDIEEILDSDIDEEMVVG